MFNRNQKSTELFSASLGHGFGCAVLLSNALKGHDFSRAIKAAKKTRALAPERTGAVEDSVPLRLKPSIFPCRRLARRKPSPFKAAEQLAWLGIFVLVFSWLASALSAQTIPPPTASATDSRPLAIVPLDSAHPDQAAKVTGALEVSQGSAVIVGSGTITSGASTTNVELPYRGTLRVCASSTIKLAADTSATSADVPPLMMALDHGAIEAGFATGRDSDVLLTPDFRILISGPGAVNVKVRLAQNGDTCVDNAGINAPYVLVSSVFDGGAYRVQPGQRVMFQHGSLHEVVDQEKEPCGCPPPATPEGNQFPLAQSEGLAPVPAPAPITANNGKPQPQPVPPLVYNSADHAPTPMPVATPPPDAAPPAPKKKPGMFGGLGKFFRRLFGGE